ncbi:hypothetical protein K469DRAFT_691477 [Zopfia rhizophila CBS 207.26]|uniref:Uncharacterized protein n=1 Tax=Zopfia rhizophila CBS 207.26 TaxID=1314779 RepID=A0A6A6DV32_9PEZI|nr:hypothetical protein K469DRAFT_691477 [Zopfia rhizophila CBS 207.26]
MAPTPADDAPLSPPSPSSSEPAKQGFWGTATIVSVAIFGFFIIAFAITLTAYCLHKRAQRKKLPPSHRGSTYRPFRTNSTESGLLANVAPTPEADERSSMFSKDRSSSVSLYIPEEHGDRRQSMETVSLIPLHITHAEEIRDPMDRMNSTGSGVSDLSRGSSRISSNTSGSLGIRNLPIPEEALEADPGVRRMRPRSTSTASVRYYEMNAREPAPEVPTILHTPSQ